MEKNAKKILITGVSGLLGNNLAFCFKRDHPVMGWYSTHPVQIDGALTQKVDLLSPEDLSAGFSSFFPDVVIHCAALANVDYCQLHQDEARRFNVSATERLLAASGSTGAKFIYISTDSVYDGRSGDFSESAAVAPVNYYGVTKYQGEKAVLQLSGSVVLRTNFFGWNIQPKRCFAELIIDKLRRGETICGFNDVYFSSIYTFQLSSVIEAVIEKDLSGVYNCASRSFLSKYEFACGIARELGFPQANIRPSSIGESELAAPRGRNLTVNVTKLEKDLGVALPTIEGGIESFCRDYRTGIREKMQDDIRLSAIA